MLISICVRGGSRGIPRKWEVNLGGIPLIEYTLQIAEKTKFDKIVCSEDDEILDYCKSRGFPTLKRPPELATDESSKWDVFRFIGGEYKFDYLVDLDIGCPFREMGDITACHKLLQSDPEIECVATVYQSERNPYFNMVMKYPDGYYKMVKPNFSPIVRRQDAPVVYSVSPSVFAVKYKALYYKAHWSQMNFKIVEVPRERGWDIDTPDDLRYAEWIRKQ